MAALTQRRQFDANHVESIVKILPELSTLHMVGEIAIGSRDHTGVDFFALVRAQRANFLVLQ